MRSVDFVDKHVTKLLDKLAIAHEFGPCDTCPRCEAQWHVEDAIKLAIRHGMRRGAKHGK
jgi:hypothetical protein